MQTLKEQMTVHNLTSVERLQELIHCKEGYNNVTHRHFTMTDEIILRAKKTIENLRKPIGLGDIEIVRQRCETQKTKRIGRDIAIRNNMRV